MEVDSVNNPPATASAAPKRKFEETQSSAKRSSVHELFVSELWTEVQDKCKKTIETDLKATASEIENNVQRALKSFTEEWKTKNKSLLNSCYQQVQQDLQTRVGQQVKSELGKFQQALQIQTDSKLKLYQHEQAQANLKYQSNLEKLQKQMDLLESNNQKQPLQQSAAATSLTDVHAYIDTKIQGCRSWILQLERSLEQEKRTNDEREQKAVASISKCVTRVGQLENEVKQLQLVRVGRLEDDVKRWEQEKNRLNDELGQLKTTISKLKHSHGERRNTSNSSNHSNERRNTLSNSNAPSNATGSTTSTGSSGSRQGVSQTRADLEQALQQALHDLDQYRAKETIHANGQYGNSNNNNSYYQPAPAPPLSLQPPNPYNMLPPFPGAFLPPNLYSSSAFFPMIPTGNSNVSLSPPTISPYSNGTNSSSTITPP